MTNTANRIRKSYKLIFWFSLAVLVTIAGIYFHSQIDLTAFLIGYLAGVAGYLALSLTFSYLDKLPAWFRLIAIMSTSFKILFLLAFALLLKLLGFSIAQVAAGILLSQFLIIFSLVIIVYSSRNSVENNIKEGKN
jgi:hypothetical protein